MAFFLIIVGHCRMEVLSCVFPASMKDDLRPPFATRPRKTFSKAMEKVLRGLPTENARPSYFSGTNNLVRNHLSLILLRLLLSDNTSYSNATIPIRICNCFEIITKI